MLMKELKDQNGMIEVAKTAGFCYGVKRAVNGAYKVCDEKKDAVTLGALIHNKAVCRDLEEKGIRAVENTEDIKEGQTVIIRAHGVGEDVMKKLSERNVQIVDLTCPFVKKIHNIVKEYHEKGYKIVIIGDKDHPEVIGINGWCGNDAFITYSPTEEFPPEIQENKVCIVAQTTINKNIFIQIVQNIKNTCQNPIIFDTICSATKERQEEAEVLAGRSDIMFVIGGAQSSNSRKLFGIAKAACAESYFIESYEDIPRNLYLKKER